MKRQYSYTILLISVIVALYFIEKYVDQNNIKYPSISKEKKEVSTAFKSQLLPTSTTGVIISHAYYTLSYSESHEQAEWVAYELKKSHLSNNEFKRPYFIEDKEVTTKSAHWRNYKRSGYDRGHLCPAADRKFSYEAYHETFLTSNISPQDHDFNSGIWNRLEQKTRRWAKEKNGVYVITGGVLKEGLRSIGEEHVSVPESFYKIVVDVSEKKISTISFLIPNKETSASYFDFVISIDELEKKTGIDFFKELPDTQENKLESSLNSWGWQ